MVFVIIFLVVAVAVAYFLWNKKTDSKIDRLRTDGAATTATLTKVHVGGSGSRKTANLHYRYSDSQGVSHTGRTLEFYKGSKNSYEKKEGDDIEIKYLPTEPTFSRWADEL